MDSALILCFRELWERLAAGLPPSAVDRAQVQHMAHWLETKVAGYATTPPELSPLAVIFEATRQGWELMLEGVYTLAASLETGEGLDESRELAEEGEDVLQQLEQAVAAQRPELAPAYY